jgi:putative cardiolipin synthase
MRTRVLPVAIAILLLGACATQTADLPARREGYRQPAMGDVSPAGTGGFSVLIGDGGFLGSPDPEVGRRGLFPLHHGKECSIGVLPNGEDSFAQRMQALEGAKKSIRIQALIFTGDEAGLRIMEILKRKHAEGLDVRVVVDAFSNPGLQTQNMYFDLKQNGIEVEGYEAFLLQWLNETHPNMRFHEKMWLIDADTPQGIAVVGGLNIANEYFRISPSDPIQRWRDQDVVVRGAVIQDMARAFDRNFDMFVGVKKSRGILNTNKAWDNTRSAMIALGAKVPFHFSTNEALNERVDELASRPAHPDWQEATCRFVQNRPRLGETYLEQAYWKLIGESKDEVLVANAYLVPSRELIAALQDAARRCVRVIVLTNSPATNDLPELTMVGRKYYEELLAVNGEPKVEACGPAKGLQVWEWVGHTREHEKATDGTMHAKFAVFDRQASLVGSYNLDPRSERLNSETALIFENRELSTALARLIYEHDLAYSRPISRKMAATFKDPAEALYKLRKTFGDLFEEHL